MEKKKNNNFCPGFKGTVHLQIQNAFFSCYLYDLSIWIVWNLVIDLIS